ncbi:type IVB secretion system protein IcmH/DotU [Vibrio tapetis]|uniref:SPOR domain-containing protein n=1 Tax=Vibrio tapetis subsp. tapetis TaxID=1671868 RepID=A0A2N8ZJR5_9VIBR|nr:type IVB secretion system protein IcmH/DotU [Vibrio tapetis]SON52145.1 conserved protein of unknown function [Vibrio tapetis subsp. tapetis]
MEFLDEDTLVWDKNDRPSLDKTGAEPHASRSVQVRATVAQNEFLSHFDKAENQLLNISSGLLATTLKIATIAEPDDLTSLRNKLIDDINHIKSRGAELTYPIAVIDKLCFLYAVVIDEFIIYSQWGEKRGWENKTLLSQLFGMRNGGELFFSVAEKAIRQPHKLIDLLEIIYLFINIGFKGQYRGQNSEQLKIFTHQLEQLISQYRQPSKVFCHTRIKLPKIRQPIRKQRFVSLTLLFCGLVITCVGITEFWYHNTHPQRVRDFELLEEYSQRYVLSGEVKDIVFISSDKDLEVAPKKASKVELVDTPAPPSMTTSHSSWLVQLATFSNQQNALLFSKHLSPSAYEPSVEPFKNYYRVIVRTNTSEQALKIKNWYQDNDQINAIIVRNNGTQNDKETK